MFCRRLEVVILDWKKETVLSGHSPSVNFCFTWYKSVESIVVVSQIRFGANPRAVFETSDLSFDHNTARKMSYVTTHADTYDMFTAK